MGRLNLLGGQSNLLGGKMPTQVTCYLLPCSQQCVSETKMTPNNAFLNIAAMLKQKRERPDILIYLDTQEMISP